MGLILDINQAEINDILTILLIKLQVMLPGIYIYIYMCISDYWRSNKLGPVYHITNNLIKAVSGNSYTIMALKLGNVYIVELYMACILYLMVGYQAKNSIILF